jgi:hypothetical protein
VSLLIDHRSELLAATSTEGRQAGEGSDARLLHTVSLPSGQKPPAGFTLAGTINHRLLGRLDVYQRTLRLSTKPQEQPR